MGIGFFRKLKDFGSKIINGGKKFIKKVLPIAAPIIKTVVPKVLPQAVPLVNPVLNIASNFTGAELEPPEDADDYDDDDEYMKLKNGI